MTGSISPELETPSPFPQPSTIHPKPETLNPTPGIISPRVVLFRKDTPECVAEEAGGLDTAASVAAAVCAAAAFISVRHQPFSSTSLFLSSLEFSERTIYEPYIRALLGTAQQFC